MSIITTEVKERPILFSAPMVRAILSGAKTQTRRVLKSQPHYSENHKCWMLPCGRGTSLMNRHRRDVFDKTTGKLLSREEYELPLDEWLLSQSPFVVGDHLWVRENFYVQPELWAANRGPQPIHYAADVKPEEVEDYVQKPCIHMPRWASRITLEITGVKVERLNEISEEDAKAEGVRKTKDVDVSVNEDGSVFGILGAGVEGWSSARQAFEVLWNSINGRDAWALNPLVWCISFKRIEVKS